MRRILLVLAFALSASACGGGENDGDALSTCTGTLSGLRSGTFNCAFQGSYASGSALSWNANDPAMGINDISIAMTLSTQVTVRSYEIADVQSLNGQVVHADEGVYQVNKGPMRGAARFVISHVNPEYSTDQSRNYGLGGTVDATLIDSTGTSTATFTLHIDF
jgi:hypothetical protein